MASTGRPASCWLHSSTGNKSNVVVSRRSQLHNIKMVYTKLVNNSDYKIIFFISFVGISSSVTIPKLSQTSGDTLLRNWHYSEDIRKLEKTCDWLIVNLGTENLNSVTEKNWDLPPCLPSLLVLQSSPFFLLSFFSV